MLQQIDESIIATTCKLAKKITLLDGVLLMKAAWEKVDAITIRNCWVKAGLKMGPHERPAYTSQMIVPSELPMDQKQWEHFITTDDDLEVMHVLDENEIVDIVQAHHEEEKKDYKKDEEEDLDEEPIPTVTETRNALNALKRGLLGQGFAEHDNLLAKLENASHQVLTADLKHTTILRFFQQN